jgi:hypothetical protein
VPGEKVPLELFVIPVPLHVPPAVAAFKLNELVFEQTGEIGVMELFGTLFTIIVSWSLPGQAPVTR